MRIHNQVLRTASRSLGGLSDKRTRSTAWTESQIIAAIQRLHADGEPLNSTSVVSGNGRLYNAARKVFGEWGKAVAAAGIDYEEIRQRPQARDWNQEQVRRSMQNLLVDAFYKEFLSEAVADGLEVLAILGGERKAYQRNVLVRGTRVNVDLRDTISGNWVLVATTPTSPYVRFAIEQATATETCPHCHQTVRVDHLMGDGCYWCAGGKLAEARKAEYPQSIQVYYAFGASPARHADAALKVRYVRIETLLERLRALPSQDIQIPSRADRFRMLYSPKHIIDDLQTWLSDPITDTNLEVKFQTIAKENQQYLDLLDAYDQVLREHEAQVDEIIRIALHAKDKKAQLTSYQVPSEVWASATLPGQPFDAIDRKVSHLYCVRRPVFDRIFDHLRSDIVQHRDPRLHSAAQRVSTEYEQVPKERQGQPQIDRHTGQILYKRGKMTRKGSWGKAVDDLLGLPYENAVMRPWTEARMVAEIRRIYRLDQFIVPEVHDVPSLLSASEVASLSMPLFQACSRDPDIKYDEQGNMTSYRAGFASWEAAVRAAGIDYAALRKQEEWTPEAVIQSIRDLVDQMAEQHIQNQWVASHHNRLYQAARRKFGSWRKAVYASGVDPKIFGIRASSSGENEAAAE